MNADEREEIAASVAAHDELGPRYDAALAEGLVERIGEEIDKRVDARLRGMGQQPHQEPEPRKRSPGHQVVPPGYQGAPGGQPVQASQGTAQPPAHRGNGVSGVILGLGSMGLGVGATGIVASHHAGAFAQVVMILLIWAAIAIINIAYSQRR